jgi:hypothetical protein
MGKAMNRKGNKFNYLLQLISPLLSSQFFSGQSGFQQIKLEMKASMLKVIKV